MTDRATVSGLCTRPKIRRVCIERVVHVPENVRICIRVGIHVRGGQYAYVSCTCIRNGFKGYRIYVLKANLVAKIGSLTRLHIIFRQIGQIRNTKNDFISRK